jgi:hypothetical protein
MLSIAWLTKLFGQTDGQGKTIALLVGLLAVLLAIGGGMVVGWRLGAALAEAKGEAKFEKREAEYARLGANATEETRQKTERLAERGAEIGLALAKANRELDAAREEIAQRRRDVAKGVPAACVFGSDFVRWWNDAAHLGPGSGAEADDPGRAAARPGAAEAVPAGVR